MTEDHLERVEAAAGQALSEDGGLHRADGSTFWTPRERRRSDVLFQDGWRVCVVDREARVLRRTGCPMRRVGPVWYAPGWAVFLVEELSGWEQVLDSAVDRYLRGLDPEAILGAYALGGGHALQALLVSDPVLALPPRPLRLKGARKSTARVSA